MSPRSSRIVLQCPRRNYNVNRILFTALTHTRRRSCDTLTIPMMDDVPSISSISSDHANFLEHSTESFNCITEHYLRCNLANYSTKDIVAETLYIYKHGSAKFRQDCDNVSIRGVALLFIYI